MATYQLDVSSPADLAGSLSEVSKTTILRVSNFLLNQTNVFDDGKAETTVYTGGDGTIPVPASTEVLVIQGTGENYSVTTTPNLEAIILDQDPSLTVVGDDGVFVAGSMDADQISISGSGDNLVDGGAGADTIVAGGGADTIWGGASADYLVGGTGDNQLLEGNIGYDTLVAGSGNNQTLLGGLGNDSLVAGDGDGQFLSGGYGADTLVGGAGAQTLMGGAGDDLFQVGNGNTTIIGGDGTDTAELGRFESEVASTDTSPDGALTITFTDDQTITLSGVEDIQFKPTS